MTAEDTVTVFAWCDVSVSSFSKGEKAWWWKKREVNN